MKADQSEIQGGISSESRIDGSKYSKAVPRRYDRAKVTFGSSSEYDGLLRKYKLHKRMKLLSFRGSEPSKVSGSLTLPTAPRDGVSRRRSSRVINIIASARFGVVSSTNGVPTDTLGFRSGTSSSSEGSGTSGGSGTTGMSGTCSSRGSTTGALARGMVGVWKWNKG